MKIISDFGKALETMSREIESVPIQFYWVSAVIILGLLFLYFVIIPKSKVDASKKERYKMGCLYAIFFLYVIGIFVVTVFTRETGDTYRIQLSFLDGLRDRDHLGRSAVRDLLNFVFFIPAGLLFAWACRGKHKLLKVFGMAMILSLSVEVCQLAGKYGTFDVDDILFNVLGGFVGGCIYKFWAYAFAGKSAGRYCLRAVMAVFSVIILCGFGGLGTYHFLRLSGAKAVKANISTADNRMTSKDADGQMYSDDPDLVWHDGKAYRYNDQLITLLIMGIDQRSAVIEQRENVSGESGQADTIFLLVMDQVKNRMKVIGISRDTMTEIKTFDYKGNYLGESVNHIGLAYAFGDGKEISCQYMVDAVSNLFYGIPINGYVALNMQSIIRINDAVGGVPVYIEEDLTQADASLVQGQRITLMGRQALMFMKWRDTSIPHSNNLRVARQKQYLVNFMKQAIEAVKKDVTLPVTLYQGLADEMVTDIGLDQAVYLVTEALTMPLNENGITMLKSEAVEGSVYDEIYVDDNALYELILNTFYTEEEMEGGKD